MGNVKLAGLKSQLAGLRAFVRAAVDREETDWTLRTCKAIVGQRPPNWQPARWEYTEQALLADEMPAEALAAAFGPEAGTLTIGATTVRVAPAAPHGPFGFGRSPARRRYHPLFLYVVSDPRCHGSAIKRSGGHGNARGKQRFAGKGRLAQSVRALL